MVTPTNLIRNFYIGKVVTGFQFGQNEGEGDREATLPQITIDANLVFDGEDVGALIKLKKTVRKHFCMKTKKYIMNDPSDWDYKEPK